ncbi:Acg family FMN-binding oxidoreductase [Fodinicurvata fenggangensis]|uniref:Acg family FMN-binding oxidoreductase n=1 Tax=Fodinicurvata fenggangensis TaxID=1121830 RepID=UPI00069200D4|nr:hypothetical protein [Fodinicurvata fenggangensis]
MRLKMTRRQVLGASLAGFGVAAGGGLAWRAWDNGVFSVGEGPAYAPWHSWTDAEDGPLALVKAGILASNAHNTQPWRFQVGSDSITLYADHSRHLGSFDPFRREMMLSLGCVLENMAQAARAQGLDAEVSATPSRPLTQPRGDEIERVAVLRLSPGKPATTDLFKAIPDRHTHRGSYDTASAVPGDLEEELQALVSADQPVRLYLFGAGEEVDRDKLGALIVSSTEAIIEDRQMAKDSARWFRFDWQSVQEHRDGVTLDTVGLPPLLNAVAKILPAPSDEEADQQWLKGTRDVHVATAPLLGMIAVRDLYDPATALQAGRLWQRLHLWLTANGFVAQPLNQPVEMVDREAQTGAPPVTADRLASLTGGAAWRPTFVFRAGQATDTARLSPRRPLDQVLVT